MSSERRLFARVNFDTMAQLISTGEPKEVHVHDLSFKGALVEAPSGWVAPIGAPCVLRIHLANSDTNITMSAKVAHVEGTHAGLLCQSIDLDSMTHLRQLIQFNLGDPQLLEREFKALAAE